MTHNVSSRLLTVKLGSFENRKSLPEPWCGIRDEILSELTGIPGCIFVHANGFIGGHANYEVMICAFMHL